MFRNLLLSMFLCTICFSSFGQKQRSAAEIENDLVLSFKKIDYWQAKSGSGMPSASDSLTNANALFAKKLQFYTSRYNFTIDQKFDRLINPNLGILTSDDGLLRIYTWDTQLGGTMHSFENVLQYKTGQKVNSVIDASKNINDYVYSYSKIATFKAAGKTYYLATYKGIYSTKDAGEGIRVFTLANNALKQANILKTSTGLHHQIYYSYDFSTVMDLKVRPSIHFDPKTNIIYIPLVVGQGRVTNGYITYKFTGQYFEKVKS